jgi:hypothetical protein
MKNKQKQFSLDTLIGNWESVNLNPTVIIYKNNDTYLLSIIYINETSKQASLSTYEIEQDEDRYFISYNLKRTVIEYDAKLDTLILSSFGEYIRN